MKVSIYHDVGGLDTSAHLGAHLDAMAELRPWCVNVMINDISDKRYRCRWTVMALGSYVHALKGMGIEVGLTSWAWPSRDWVDAAVRELPRVMRAVGVTKLEFDMEGNWKKRHILGYRTMEQAADALLGGLHEVEGVEELGVTTYTSMIDEIPEVLSWVDEVTVQAYSCASKPECAWGGTWGPRWHQDTSIAMARKAMEGGPEGQHLVIGLPAWDQKWDGHDREEALSREWEACERSGVGEVRLWSWANLVGTTGTARRSCWEWIRERVRRVR